MLRTLLFYGIFIISKIVAFKYQDELGVFSETPYTSFDRSFFFIFDISLNINFAISVNLSLSIKNLLTFIPCLMLFCSCHLFIPSFLSLFKITSFLFFYFFKTSQIIYIISTVREGYLYWSKGLSPYSGDVFYLSPLLLPLALSPIMTFVIFLVFAAVAATAARECGGWAACVM